ncbi:monocyte to macrophage differentiation factor 2a isoform X1 [Acanthochromis polyacanthus]|uniref:Monocyte to macrophage differentiation associated 2 n=1 Tax=Acanthochromis polyacanthus TaxID=80966 RepID=A0A3Q1FZU8_9TELE|nr:monocyte to macrophage differentiation factor 2a isoform X1 [Acanthochromis polyacanthus]
MFSCLDARRWDIRNGESVVRTALAGLLLRASTQPTPEMDFKKTKFGRFMNCRVPGTKRYQPTEYEHAANCATHGLWILPSLVGGSVLYFLSVDQWHCVAAWLYGSGLTGLFITSTLFHTAAWKISHLRTVEQRFHMCDRMAIYFFIAASYSPWLMLRELGPWACHMRWLIWVMACIGSMYVFFFHERYKLVELLGYVTMGAVPALVILSMVERAGVCELAVGGVFYVVGIVFFKSDGLVPFAHAIWHLFVAVGAGIHYYAIWRYLYLPGPVLQTSR